MAKTDNPPTPDPVAPNANPPAAPPATAPAAAPAVHPAAPAPGDAPERDKRGQLTRAGMEAVVRRGGSVLHGGRIVTRVEDLPSAAELSQGDQAAEQAARASIDERQAALDRERAVLDQRRAADAAGRDKDKGDAAKK